MGKKKGNGIKKITEEEYVRYLEDLRRASVQRDKKEEEI